MARGSKASEGRSARSEAGTIARGDTAQARLDKILKLVKEASDKRDVDGLTGSDLAQALSAGLGSIRGVVTGTRIDNDRYEIRIEGQDALKARGKLNLIEGTIDGKKIDTAFQDRGAFDISGTRSRNSDDAAEGFEIGKKNANKDQGFIFVADDDDKVYAIPHTWDTNNPQGTVGIFRGDRITNVGDKGKVLNLRVIGTFDSSPRGLQLAAAASGDFIGRTNGIKQTATILASSSYTKDSVTAGFKSGESVIQRAASDIKGGRLGDKSDGYGDLKRLVG